jgi:hypothetical protein
VIKVSYLPLRNELEQQELEEFAWVKPMVFFLLCHSIRRNLVDIFNRFLIQGLFDRWI